MLLSNLELRRQRQEADCLVACCQMVLDYLGVQRRYSWLSNVLETTAIGTPFSNVAKLGDTLGVVIELGDNATLAQFASIFESGLPLIAAVDSDDPIYWPHCHNHAVVMVGFSEAEVYINNPALGDAPQIVDVETFLWAWSRRDYEYAIIRLAGE